MSAPIQTNMVWKPISTPLNSAKKYLLHFANEYIDFRVAELESIVKLLGTKIGINKAEYDEKNPFLVVDLPSEDAAKQIMKRTVLIRSVYELWSEGKSHSQLHSNLRKYPRSFMQPFFQADRSFKIKVDTYNKSIKQVEKVQRIKNLPIDVLEFQGRANLKNPDDMFSLFEYYGREGTPSSEEPLSIYFGRWIADGQRDQISQYHLQNRHFIGNTSMDAGLSLLMANLGQVKDNMLILDPFVGTGSLLVACAHFGSYVMGADIDYLLLHARGKPSRHNQKKRCPNESIRSNLKQYGLESYYIDVLIADSSKHELWKGERLFDAIITDPPYGIREPTTRIGSKVEDVYISEELKDGHIPQKVQYKITDLYTDLLMFAARYLKLNGKLVFWFPVYRPDYSEEGIPRHPCFQLVSNCEQVFQAYVSRRLITMEKIKEVEDVEPTAFVEKDMYGGTSFRKKFFSKTVADTPTSKTQGKTVTSELEAQLATTVIQSCQLGNTCTAASDSHAVNSVTPNGDTVNLATTATNTDTNDLIEETEPVVINQSFSQADADRS